jgi:hypothetical protein
MATVNKDFKIKSGLIVEGTTATVNGYDVLTKKQADQDYIVGLIGGSASSDATPDTVVLRDGDANFAANEITANLFVGDLDGQAATVDSLSGHTTTEISEGSNLYFTTQRAIDAGDGVFDAYGAATTAEGNANDYTDSAITALNLSGTYDALGAATTALNDAKAYTDQEVAALVDSAPALLDTLNELAAAIADNPNYATDVANLIADKADTSYVNQEISDLDTAAQGYASTAQTNAQNYADNAINALSTSDIEEGTNQYFTDGRAKTSAADLLTGATLTNITITGSGSGLTITAENGVADSTTSDLTEGSNLYFTAQRAVDALEAVVPNFTAVELNSVAKQVAATTSVPVAGISTGYSWAKADYRSAEFLVKVAYGSHTEISKLLVTLDSSDNISITEYGIVGTNGSASSVSAGISGNDVQLQVTTVNNNSTVTVVGTLLA